MATVQKLVVEVVEARNLAPKDGHGTSSPYVVIDYHGQRRKTGTAVRDLNPVWNQPLEFNFGKRSDVFGDVLEIDVVHDRGYGPTRRNNFLGRLRLSSSQFVRRGEEALVYYPLEKKNLFSWVQGEIGLRIFYYDEVLPPPAPAPASPPAGEAKPVENPDPATAEPAAPAEFDAKPPEAEKSEAGPTEPPVEEPDQPETGSAGEGQPLENAVAEAEKNKPEPTEENTGDAEPPPNPPPPPVLESETVEGWVPPPEMMAAAVTGLAPQTKIAEIVRPNQIRRSPTASSFASDLTDSFGMDRTSFDLVEKMHYLFVRVVKARSLPTNGNPVARIVVANRNVRSRPAQKTAFFEWDQTFAFGRDAPESESTLEISVWDPPPFADPDAGQNFLGGICFDTTEIPLRDPPDSPLAPQWYRLEGSGAHNGDLMLATWVGTQADDSFPDAWKSDTSANISSRAKVYVSPKLWYLRATIIEAQDVLQLRAHKEASFQIKAQLGFQAHKTKHSVTPNGRPSWNEDLIFVVAEPFTDQLVFTIETRQPKGPVTLASLAVPLTDIERRVDDRRVASRWFTFSDPNDDVQRAYKGRLHLRLCFDGGYHVMDEAANTCSDYRPTARQLWKPAVGTVELGIIGCRNLLPMKTVHGKGTTDAYCVAKYGSKWIRTRAVSDSLDPKWNEQYTWRVYDPCTVLTIGVFDSWGVFEIDGEEKSTRPDFRIGKVRVRISTLETGKVYRNTYPLLVLSNTGSKKMGDVEIAIRFVRIAPRLDLVHVYTLPLLPLMHHTKPLGVVQQDLLRNVTVKIVAEHLSRSEPPLRREVVLNILDADTHAFSMRKVRANWYRIINVIGSLIEIVRWVESTRSWKHPTATVLVHALLLMLVLFPDLIVPTLAFYVFAIGAWNYRLRARDPLPHFCPKISFADGVDGEELDEEFDAPPSTRSPEAVRARYDRLRAQGARVQTFLGDLATQGERMQALVTWRDPRATGMFVALCFVVAVVLYLVPSKMVAMALGFYYLRHPIFRDRAPAPAINFFRRLPSLSDRIM